MAEKNLQKMDGLRPDVLALNLRRWAQSLRLMIVASTETRIAIGMAEQMEQRATELEGLLRCNESAHCKTQDPESPAYCYPCWVRAGRPGAPERRKSRHFSNKAVNRGQFPTHNTADGKSVYSDKPLWPEVWDEEQLRHASDLGVDNSFVRSYMQEPLPDPDSVVVSKDWTKSGPHK